MEACVLIARTNKLKERQNKVLFIDARECLKIGKQNNSISQEDIDKISKVYFDFEEVQGFSTIVDTSRILENDGSMSLSLYLARIISDSSEHNFEDAYSNWLVSQHNVSKRSNELTELLEVE
jgi:type I restriction enzyme M protein